MNKEEAKKVKCALIMKDMSATDLAKELGISRQMLNCILNGNAKGAKYIENISKITGVEFESETERLAKLKSEVKMFMLAKGITQTELAERTGIAQSHIARIFNTEIKSRNLKKIMIELGMEEEW